MQSEIAEFVKHYAAVESEYPQFVKEVSKACTQLYESGTADEQHFIDTSLNICPFLRMPFVYTILFAVDHPVVIPEHLYAPGDEQPSGWKWGQVLYGIARSTIEADIRKNIEARRELAAAISA